MQDFIDFAKSIDLEMSATRIATRKGKAWADHADIPAPVHFHVILTATIAGKPVTVWSGEYSQGIGIAESWAKKNTSKFIGARVGQAGHGFPMTDALRTGPGRGKAWRVDSNYWENIRDVYARAVANQKPGKELLQPADMLLCLQMDIMGADQHFEDWADDLGIGHDSHSGYQTWEACNTIRRDLMRAFGAKFEEFEALQED